MRDNLHRSRGLIFTLADVFAPASGNPLAVVTVADDLAATVVAAIAAVHPVRVTSWPVSR